MPEEQPLPKWILIVSGLFALMEIGVSMQLYFSPESIEVADHAAKGVDYLFGLWAARQFALGFIFAFATFRRSAPMLTVAYVFFLVMFAGDLLVGITHKDNALIGSAVVMGVIASAMIFAINRKR